MDPDRDVLTYDFEIYSDSLLTTLVSGTSGMQEAVQMTSWMVDHALNENQTYYWRARAFDGQEASNWTAASSFMVNTANDAPSSPKLLAPEEGSSVNTLTPTLSVMNATDPDSTSLTYTFEIYSSGILVQTLAGIAEDGLGITSASLATPLTDNTVYQWRVQAYDGQLYGPWTSTASFTAHIPVTSINATIDFDPNTLNKAGKGTWVVVYIELPAPYKPDDVDISSIRMEGAIPAETKPYGIGDNDKDGIPDLMVKFKRSDVIDILPVGEKVPVHVTGRVGDVTFDGVDIIRVID
jgi:transposase-like protein